MNLKTWFTESMMRAAGTPIRKHNLFGIKQVYIVSEEEREKFTRHFPKYRLV